MTASSDPAGREPVTVSNPLPEKIEPSLRATPVKGAASSSNFLWVCVLGAGLGAGLLAWFIGERMYNYYRPSAEAQQNRFEFAALNREQGRADQKNAAIAYGTFGALLGLLVGASGGLYRRSATAVSSAALAGFLVGGIGGALAAYGLAPVHLRFYSDGNPSLLLPLLVRGGICAVAGMAAGLAFGLGRYGPAGVPRALAGGLLGSLFGTLAVEVIYAFAFPMDRNDDILPTSVVSRLLSYILIAVCAALGPLVLGHRRSSQAIRTS
jgi:hypothetical protein